MPSTEWVAISSEDDITNVSPRVTATHKRTCEAVERGDEAPNEARTDRGEARSQVSPITQFRRGVVIEFLHIMIVEVAICDTVSIN